MDEITRNLPDMDKIFWRYLGLVGLMEDHPATYGMDTLRTEAHKELEAYWPGQEQQLAEVLHDMPASMCPKLLRAFMSDTIEGFRAYMVHERELLKY